MPPPKVSSRSHRRVEDEGPAANLQNDLIAGNSARQEAGGKPLETSFRPRKKTKAQREAEQRRKMQAAKKAAAKQEAEKKPPTTMEKAAGVARGSVNFFAVLGYYLVGLAFYTQVEGWKPHEALYFTTVTVTTVGYGDFSPATDEGKIFTIFFILIGLGSIGNILTGSIEAMLDRAEEAAEKAADKARANDFDADAPLVDESFIGETKRFLNQHGRKLLLTIGLIVGVIVTGTIFFGLSEGVYGDFVTICAGNDPDMQPSTDSSLTFGYNFNSASCSCELTASNVNGTEVVNCDDDKWSGDCEEAELSSVITNLPFCARPFLDALYWTWVTTFTVGYGDWGLTEERSLIFSTFFLVISTAVVCVSIGNFIEISLEESKQAELKAMTQSIVASCSSEEAFNEMLLEVDGADGEGDGTIDKGEFLAHCLSKLNLVRKDECTRWLDHFKEIDEDNSGFLDSDDLAAMAEKEENERMSGVEAPKPEMKKKGLPVFDDGAGSGEEPKKKKKTAVRFSMTEEVASPMGVEEKAAI